MARKTAAGNGTIRKKTIMRKGKQYTYWEARYSAGRDPGTGKQIQKSITGQTQKEVRLKMQEMIRQVDAGSYKEPCKLTLAQWLDMWTAEYLNNLKRLTQEQYRMQCTYYLKPCLGAAKLSALNTHMIQQFINSLSNGERAELSAKTIKNIYGVLHKALNQAVENEFISHNPASACKLPKIKKPPIHPLEPEEITRLITAAQEDDYGNLFVSAIFTGMRQGELLGLPWENVDFDNGVIRIMETAVRNENGELVHKPTTKNSASRRTVPMMQPLREALERADRTTEYVVNIRENAIRHHYKLACEKAGVPYVRAHGLRHSFASLACHLGMSEETTMAIGGWADYGTMKKIYTHVSDADLIKDSGRMLNFYSQPDQEEDD